MCGFGWKALQVGAAFVLGSAACAHTDETSVSRIIPTRVIGDADGALAFGAIGPIAAQDSLLAIVDAPTCEIVIVDRLRGRFVTRWGGCGGGPGELANLTAIAWKGDSLVVAGIGRSLIVLDPAGKEIRRIRTALGKYVMAISYIGILDDSTVVLGLGLSPSVATKGGDDNLAHSFGAIVDSRTGAIRRRILPDLDPWSRSNAGNIRAS